MTSENRPREYTPHQVAALATLLGIVAWGTAVLWFNSVSPAGAHIDELVPLATLTLLYWILIPIYGARTRWGYAAGAVSLLGLFVMGIVQAREGILIFSLTPYNLLTLVAWITAALCIYVSVRSWHERPSAPWWRPLSAAIGAVLVASLMFFALSTAKNDLYGLTARWTQNRLARKLERLDTLEKKLEFLVAEGGIPSLAAGIVVNDRLIWSGAYGEQPDVRATYNIGSVTKPVVATAVLQLYDRGLIDLNADVNQYLPFELRHPDHPAIPITVRMLLTHQSGLAHYTPQYFSYVDAEDILDWEMKQRGQSIYGEITFFDPRPPYAEFLQGYLVPGGPYYSSRVWSTRPGTTYAYSTPGYDLLGYVVEHVTGQALTDYMEENVFAPLGMTHTGLTVPHDPDRQAIPYEHVYGVLTKTNVPLPLYARRRLGGGGLYSCVADLAQFMIAHLNRGQVDGHVLLEPETVDLQHRQHVKAAVDIGMAGYGLGLNTMRQDPWQFHGHFYDFYGAKGHGGADYGYMARMYFVKQDPGGYGVIMLTNLSTFYKSDMNWLFGTYLKMDNLLMQQAKALYQQQESE